MWSLNTLWFEVAVVSGLTAIGGIMLGHFEAGKPKWQRILKFLVSLAIVVTISTIFGRAWALSFLGVLLLAVAYIHTFWLPSKGINGWTAEPREKYYKLRGWKLPEQTGNRNNER